MASLVQRFLKLRLLQLQRTFVLLGPLYSMPLIGMAIYLLYQLFRLPAESLKPLQFSVGLVAVITGIHLVRKDHHFLKLLTPFPQQIYFAEYLTFSLPVLTRITLSTSPVFALGAVLLLGGISFLPALSTPQTVRTSGLWNYISPTAYEWRTGVRNQQNELLLCAIAALLFTPLPYVSLFLMWILNTLFCSFYRYNESAQMIDRRFSQEGSSLASFLYTEQKRHATILLPYLLVYIGFHQGDWIIAVVAYVLLSIVYLYTIISKYAYYRTDQLTGPAGVMQSLAQLSPLLPFLVPLPLVLGIIQYPKALHTIRSIRYAAY